MKMRFFLMCILSVLFTSFADKPCIQRRYNHTSFVCVCNSTYCDEIDEIKPLSKGKYVIYTSSQDMHRFTKRISDIHDYTLVELKKHTDIEILSTLVNKGRLGDVIMKVVPETKFQNIFGFGGAITDTSGLVWTQLSEGSRDNLLRAYFSKTGIEYNLLRVPIGATDFSPRPYSYNTYPEDDVKLSNFSLQEEDYLYKIPVIKGAQKLSTDKLWLIAAAWGPPPWMKTNNQFGGISRLRKRYFQVYADYHIRFLQEYRERGLKFWAISTGNEPAIGISGFKDTISVGWRFKEYVHWIGHNFGPTIRKSNFSYLNILLLDDTKSILPWVINWIVRDKRASKCFDGIATHYYFDDEVPTSIIDQIHETYPSKFLIMTEASYGARNFDADNISLGLWQSAEYYFGNIISSLNNWYTSWMDWNLCLNLEGGPKWSQNSVDSAIIVDTDKDEFLKQPMYYAIGHFSKFVPRGSVRMKVKFIDGNIDNVAFLRPDNGTVVIFYNPYSHMRHIVIYEDGLGYMEFDIYGHTFHTLLYWKQ